MVSFSFGRCKGTEYRGQIKGKNPVFTGPALLQRDDDGMIRRSEKARASRCVFFAGAVARDVFSLRRRRNLRGTGRARCEGMFRGAVFDSAEDTYVGTGLCRAGKPVRFFTVDFGRSALSSVRNSALRSGRCMETAIRSEEPLSPVFSVRVCVTVRGRTIPRLSVGLRLSSLRWVVCAVPDGRIVFEHRAACLCGRSFFLSGGIRAWGVAVAR